jgi:hypothetical protein
MSQSAAAARVPARPLVRPVGRERVAPPRLRVVAPTTHRSATGLALLCVGLLGGGLLVLLLLNISIGKGAYALTRLQSQQRQLVENRQALAEEVEAVSAPQKLAATAQKLGMVPAPNAAFVQVPTGKVEGTPAIATAPRKPAPKPKPTAKGTTAKGTTPTKGTAKAPAKSGTATTKQTTKPAAKKTVKSAPKQPADSKR